MTFISNRRVVATIVAALCIAVPGSASADSLPSTYKSDAAQSGGNAGNQAGAKWRTLPSDFIGGDIAQSKETARSTYPPSGFDGGDDPADRPTAGRAPSVAPSTIEIVRPERTIVRDVDEALPLILSISALLLALAGMGMALNHRSGSTPRP